MITNPRDHLALEAETDSSLASNDGENDNPFQDARQPLWEGQGQNQGQGQGQAHGREGLKATFAPAPVVSNVETLEVPSRNGTERKGSDASVTSEEMTPPGTPEIIQVIIWDILNQKLQAV